MHSFNSKSDFGQPVQFRDGDVGVLDAVVKGARDPSEPIIRVCAVLTLGFLAGLVGSNIALCFNGMFIN